MSYTRTYHEVIHGTVSVTSQRVSSDGNVSSYTQEVPWSETVTLYVTVEDAPFQASIAGLAEDVDLTTAAVVATEAAQVVSKAENAEQVGEALATGFRTLIVSEINQQLIELREALPIKLLELETLGQRCAALREQMFRDFRRIRERYAKLFADLNDELRLRISALDGRAFQLQATFADGILTKQLSTGVTHSSIGAQEHVQATASLSAATVRRRVLGVVDSARRIIHAGRTLRTSMRDVVGSSRPRDIGQIHVPVVFIETEAMARCRAPRTLLEATHEAPLGERIRRSPWRARTSEELTRLHADTERLLGSAELTPRARQVALGLLKFQKPSTLTLS
jgi:hypothetical protein